MKKLLLLLLLIPSLLWAAPPSRIYTYTTGEIISADKNTQNEDSVFNYLSRGVDKYAPSSITTTDILDGTLVNADISGTAAITYGKLTLTDSITTGDIATGTIVNTDISYSANIQDAKLGQIVTAGKVNGSAFTSLASIPAGAGVIPAANVSFTDTTNFKIGTFTRVLNAASGDVSYTGVGFQPTHIIFFGGFSGDPKGSYNGFDNATNHYAISNYSTAGTVAIDTAYSIAFTQTAGGNTQKAIVKTFDADGFTLTWTLVGTVGADTANIFYMAFK